MKSKVAYIFLGLLLCCAGCNMMGKEATDERPTRGNIRIAVDDAYQLMAEAEIAAFEGTYKNAFINPTYAPEDSILKLFMKDSVRLMITSRPLTENEIAYLRQDLYVTKSTTIAHDAVAFIVNRSNADSLIRYSEIKDMFTGKTTSWKDINPKAPSDAIRIVFDSPGSSSVRTITRKLGIPSDTLPDYCVAAGSYPAVVDYVGSHPGAMGVISVNWISDADDSLTRSFLDKVSVVGLTAEFNNEADEYFRPHPAYIADKSYPFTREVYAISRETFVGLGSGFISYLAGDMGQRILLKMGMLPATIPVRLIQVSTE